MTTVSEGPGIASNTRELRSALALSGGGFRATLFSLGSISRLNYSGLLRNMGCVTCVSGGAIAGAYLAHCWPKLEWDEQTGSAVNLSDLFVQPVIQFCNTWHMDWRSVVARALPGVDGADWLRKAYNRQLFGGALLSSLPDSTQEGQPRLVILATNMQTGVSFRFERNRMGDYRIGYTSSSFIDIATAVAASSAFPPVLSPLVLKPKGEWALLPPRPGEPTSASIQEPTLSKLRRRVVLSDGGVYDNLGLEPIWRVDSLRPQKYGPVFVADGGAPFEILAEPWGLNPFRNSTPSMPDIQLSRVREVMISQTRALRKRLLVSEFRSRGMTGVYWGLTTDIQRFRQSHGLTRLMAGGSAVTQGLARLKTQLSKFSRSEQMDLINWGYALADSAIRGYQLVEFGDSSEPSSDWPFAERAQHY